MERIALKGTGLEVSRIALGTWAFGGDAVWGEQGDKESIDTVAAALDYGINFFDTAAAYARGRSEEVLGQALAGRRHRAVIATKVHETLDRAGVIAACEGSLRRLKPTTSTSTTCIGRRRAFRSQKPSPPSLTFSSP